MASDLAPLPCFRCGKVPTVDPNGGYPIISCDNCYDEGFECASWLTSLGAIERWNEQMEDGAADHECCTEVCHWTAERCIAARAHEARR